MLEISSILSFFIPGFLLMLFVFQKQKRDTARINRLLNIIKWVLIGLAITNCLRLFMDSEAQAVILRVQGAYGWAYILLSIASCVLPLSMLIPAFGKRVSFVFFISIAMRLGFHLERFVMVITSLERDFTPSSSIQWVLLSPIIFIALGAFVCWLLFRTPEKDAYQETIDRHLE